MIKVHKLGYKSFHLVAHITSTLSQTKFVVIDRPVLQGYFVLLRQPALLLQLERQVLVLQIPRLLLPVYHLLKLHGNLLPQLALLPHLYLLLLQERQALFLQIRLPLLRRLLKLLGNLLPHLELLRAQPR